MALFGGSRDVSLFRIVNRELMGNVISQQCAFYKFKLDETKTNIYGEAVGNKYYMGPVLINCLLERDKQSHPEEDMNIQFRQNITFKFLRDDLLDKNQDFNIDTTLYGADLVPQIGDVIFYEERYHEIDNIVINQYVLGKNPQYPNSPNPINQYLENFGSSFSILCSTHYIPSDKVGLEMRFT